MAYFQAISANTRDAEDWTALVSHIRNDWPSQSASLLSQLDSAVEAKALHILSVSRRLIRRADNMKGKMGWEPIFIEAMMLLFPMLEIIGEARHPGKGTSLGAGLEWLRDPKILPISEITTRNLKGDETRIKSLGNHMSTLSNGPRVMELFHIRNFFLHGLRNQSDPDFDMGAIRTSMNYELPKAMVTEGKYCLRVYWAQLTDERTDVSGPWVSRVASSRISPFGIMGSQMYEKGLVDPDIVKWLSKS